MRVAADRARGRTLASLCWTVISLVPGFVLPFVVSLRFSPELSDRLLLGYSILIFTTSVIGIAIEANSLAECARSAADNGGRQPLPRNFPSYMGRTVAIAAATTIASIGTLGTLYFGTGLGRPDVAWPVAMFGTAGFLDCISSIFSGVLFARGRTVAVVGLQSLRPLPPIALIVVLEHPSIVLVSVGFVVGEFTRGTALVLLTHLTSDPPPGAGRWTTRGAIWQMVATTGSQATPAVDRMLLSSAGEAGGIASYEIANRFFFAGTQLLSQGLIPSRAATWGDLQSTPLPDIKRRIRRDCTAMAAIAAAIAAVGICVLVVANGVGVLPADWETGTHWAVVAMCGLPFAIAQITLARFLIALELQRYLVPLTSLSVTVNIGLDFVLYTSLGGLGIIVAGAVAKVSALAIYTAGISHGLHRMFPSRHSAARRHGPAEKVTSARPHHPVSKEQ